MAGTPLGAPAPSSLILVSDQARPRYRVPAPSRTRRNHGVFLLGAELATIYSSRRERDQAGVIVCVGQGDSALTGSVTPTQARAIARALDAAAAAAEATRQGGAA